VVTVRLPGGRGEIQGANAESLRDEGYRQRALEVREEQACILSTLPIHHDNTSIQPITTVTNECIYFACRAVDSFKVSRVRLYCTVAAAGGTCKTILYHCDHTKSPFRLVAFPGSEATFDVSTGNLHGLHGEQCCTALLGRGQQCWWH